MVWTRPKVIGESVATEADWTGLVRGRSDPAGELRVVACLQQGRATASSPFLASGSDGHQWWVKPPQVQLKKALVTEYVVGRVGQLIGAPVCETAVIEIPTSLLPWEFRPGQQLPTGFGSATRDLPGVVTEIRGSLSHRGDDDNARRHGGVYALVDWCFGDDLQWLLHTSDQWTLYSHDHGWYLPPGGPDWSLASLRAAVDVAGPVPGTPTGLDKTHLDRLADGLEAVTREALQKIMMDVPISWPVAGAELECLGWYLEHRAPLVAARLRAL